MTDLAGKFNSFQTQVTLQHGELMQALDTIAMALGAPPSTPTTTLADIATMLSSINDSLQSIITGNNIYYGAVLSALELTNGNLDIINSNQSLNAQRLLLAIMANDPCKPCDVTPLLPPPLDATPQIVDTEHCKRMQALIYAMRRFTVKLDLLSSFGLGFSPTVIRDALTEIFTELGVTELLLYPSVGEIAKIAAAAAYYVASNIFGSGNLPALFIPLEMPLLAALYAVDTAETGKGAYEGVIAGAGLPAAVEGLFRAMAYTSVFNLYYDRSITIDLAGYNGDLCADPEPTWPPSTGCFELTSEMTELSNGFNIHCIVWPDGGFISPSSVSGAPQDLTADKAIFGHSNIADYWITSTVNVWMYWNADGQPNFEISEVPRNLPNTPGDYFTIVGGATEFTVTICVEGPA